MDVLILVDLQNDFVPGGALPVPEGHEVVPVANRLLRRFDHVVATQDWHPPDHSSFAANHPGANAGDVIQLDGAAQVLWPVHCVQETPGAELLASLDAKRIQRIFRKGTDRDVDSYSGFFDNQRRRSTGLDTFLHEFGATRLFIMGLATDYCVKYTVLDALSLNYETHLVLDGCRAVNLNPGDGAAAVEEMRGAGARIVESAALL